jgi:hypothetical protein
VGATYTPEEARTPQQKELLALSDTLLTELEQGDEYYSVCRCITSGCPRWRAAVALRLVPLALTVLAAELYNILAFHLTLSPGIAPALVACVLWVLVFLQYRDSLSGLLTARPVVQQ